MQHIEKLATPYETKGIQATQDYIDRHWVADESQYRNLYYSKSGMSALEQVLFDEQKDQQGYSYCCYCMRRLFLNDTVNGHKENITLEHIIPHKIKEAKWEEEKSKYLKFPNLQSDKNTICYGGELTPGQATKKIQSAPYPHFLSYHNLVASCDGKIFEGDKPKKSCCCNNGRGDQFVMPIFLSAELCNDISYDKKGRFCYDNPNFEDKWFASDCLNLNAGWIVQVRKIWYQLVKSEYTDKDVEKACEDLELRQNIIDDIDQDNIIAAWSTHNDMWMLFAEYVWFYGYYSYYGQEIDRILR